LTKNTISDYNSCYQTKKKLSNQFMTYKHLSSTKTLESFHNTLSGIRTGRPNSSVLEPISVEFYGSRMQIKELATITLDQAQMIITPFDKGAIKPISDAIAKSNLGVNPIDDGIAIRLNFPPLTEDTRKKLAKVVLLAMETAKISVRNNRQDILKTWKKQKDDSQISEDELKKLETELQKEVDTLNKEIETIAKTKEQDIMKI
jgi:ribosome recycling factor